MRSVVTEANGSDDVRVSDCVTEGLAIVDTFWRQERGLDVFASIAREVCARSFAAKLR